MERGKRVIFVLFLFLLLVVTMQTPVKSETSYYWVKLKLDKEVYLRGESLHITCYSNSRTFTLQIFLPNGKLYLEETWLSNETYTIRIPENAPYGYYLVKALVQGSQTSMWFTVLDVGNWQPVKFPYTVEHKGITYTFYSNGSFVAKGRDGELKMDFETLLKIAKTLGLTVSAYRNSMNFRVNIKGYLLKVNVDIVWSFLYKGCKFTVRGTLDKERTFIWKFKALGYKRILNGLRSGHLVFDWSDIKKLKYTCNYYHSLKALKITVPKQFELDPYIFEDGFESGDFSAWTGTNGNPTIVTSPVYQGDYAMKVTNLGDYVYKNLTTTYSTLYMRAYVYFESVTTSLYYGQGIIGIYAGTSFFRVGAVGNGSVAKFEIKESFGGNSADSGVIVQANTWYCLEIRYVKEPFESTTGNLTLWIDGEQKCVVEHDCPYAADQVRAGYFDLNSLGNSIVIDCVVVDDEYIGPISTNRNLTLQARDANGNNLPFAVTYKGTFSNGSSYEVASNSSGCKQLSIPSGVHTVNVWWGNHLVASTSVNVTEDTTLNINTKIQKATYGSKYLYASLNNTDLPAPTVVSGTEVKFSGVTASGSIELKLDVSNWHVQDEPVKVKVGDYMYERGATGWSWDANNKIWTFTVHFSTQDIIIYWEEPSPPSGSSGGTPSSPTSSVPAEPVEEEPAPSVPAQPTIPESYVIYQYPAVDTTMVAVGIIVICAVAYLANHYLSNYGSVSKLWRKRLERKRKVKWKR